MLSRRNSRTHSGRVIVGGTMVGLLCLTPAAVVAQDAAFLFAYRAKPGMDADFAKGYRRHLDWHAAKNDSLTWLAWTVIDGPSLGTFVDGTFGIRLAAFDDRVDQRGDGEDAGRNVTAFADPTHRQLLRLRRDLSPAMRLESAKPGTMQRVVTLAVKPGTQDVVERTFQAVAAKPAGLDYAVYERVSGGDRPYYLMIVQLDRWADIDRAASDPVAVMVRALGTSVARMEVETWAYRPDLTYTPKR